MDYSRDLNDLFRPGESPYIAMYTAGLKGIPIEEISAHLHLIGTQIRQKDINNWSRGFNKRVDYKPEPQESFNPMSKIKAAKLRQKPFESYKLSDFWTYPSSWKGTPIRFFPCSKENKPLIRWGWQGDIQPKLLDYNTAKSKSPCGWVGQNMLYQQFIVIDIDGTGHGEFDSKTINFGYSLRQNTLTFEDPKKPGSYHIYFATNRMIPVKHFPWAKIDLMGNAVNAAVYFKDKVSNGLPMATLTEQVWSQLIAYELSRKEERNGIV